MCLCFDTFIEFAVGRCMKNKKLNTIFYMMLALLLYVSSIHVSASGTIVTTGGSLGGDTSISTSIESVSNQEEEDVENTGNEEELVSAPTSTLEEIEQSIEEGLEQEKQLKEEKNDLEEVAKKLDKEIAEYNTELLKIHKEIQTVYDNIKEADIQLAIAMGEEEKQYQDMKTRIQYMYENSTRNEIYEILITAKSMRDFLNKLEYAQQITNYDRERLVEYQELVLKIEEDMKALDLENNRLEALQYRVQKKQEEVEELLKEAEITIEELEESIGDNAVILEALMAEAEAEKKRQEEAAAAAAKAKAEAEAAARAAAEAAAAAGEQAQIVPGDVLIAGEGIFAHPIPGAKYISSPFGYRYYPDPNVPTLHKGTDYAAYTGTPIYAALDGRVTIARYSASAGNYISIDHGNGLVTLYMHNSVLYVNSGDTVIRGQNIGLSGNTGSSSGPHLHFQVMYNGNPIDGTKYL